MARALQSIAIDAGQMFPAWNLDTIMHRPAVTLFSLIRSWRDYHGIATGDDHRTNRRRNAILDMIEREARA